MSDIAITISLLALVAMIGAVGYVAYQHGLFGDLSSAADPRLMMPGEE